MQYKSTQCKNLRTSITWTKHNPNPFISRTRLASQLLTNTLPISLAVAFIYTYII